MVDDKRKTRQSQTDRTPERPKKRVPVGANRNLMTLDNMDPAYQYRWVNDSPGRIMRFTQGGYEHVVHDVNVGERRADSSSGVSSVVVKDVGKGTQAYLMRIKKEYYEEDKKAKAAALNSAEESMQRNLNNNGDGSYGKVTFKG